MRLRKKADRTFSFYAYCTEFYRTTDDDILVRIVKLVRKINNGKLVVALTFSYSVPEKPPQTTRLRF